MLTKIITYTNFKGETKTETFYFNLSIAELTRINAKYEGGLEGEIEKLDKSKDVMKLFELISTIITTSVGLPTANGDGFSKDKMFSSTFENSDAFDTLFMELINNPESLQAFIIGIMPKGIRNAQSELIRRNGGKAPESIDEVHKLIESQQPAQPQPRPQIGFNNFAPPHDTSIPNANGYTL